jgi:hypothetical protein
MCLIIPHADIRNSQRLRTVLVAVAALIPLVIAGIGHSFFSLNDDGAVLSLLRSGDARTFVISYPMSYLLVTLYKLNAQIPWYSFFVLGMLSTATATMTYAVLSNKYADLVQKAVLLSFVLYFCLFSSNNINYTTVVTLLFVSVHMLALSIDSAVSKLMIVLLVPLVLLTRSGDVIMILLAFSALPLILNGKSYKSFAARGICFVVIFLAAFALSTYPHDSDYETYKKFNSARSAYNDLNYPMKISSIDAEDENLFNYFFTYDEEVFPTALLTENAPTITNLLQFRLYNTGLKQIKETLFRHLPEFMLIAVSILYVMYRRSLYNRAFIAIISQVVMCMVLFRIRDVDRLSFGILFLMLSGIHLMPKSVEESIKPFESITVKKHVTNRNGNYYDVALLSLNRYMAVLIILMILSLSVLFRNAIDTWSHRGSILRPKEYRLISENIRSIPELKNTILVPDLLSASSFYFTFPLGHEKSMLGYPAEGWLPAGWLSRSPIYYKTLRSKGSESFSDLLKQGKIALVYVEKSDNTWARKVYTNYINKHYASTGCGFVPDVLYRDKFVSVEVFRIDCR